MKAILPKVTCNFKVTTLSLFVTTKVTDFDNTLIIDKLAMLGNRKKEHSKLSFFVQTFFIFPKTSPV